MSRWACHPIAAALAMATAALPTHADDAVVAQRRAALERERATVESQYRRDEKRCASRFAVTACIDDVKARRRLAMEPLERERAALDDFERRQRATERLRRIEEKRREAAHRQPPGSQTAREPGMATVPGAPPRAGRPAPPRSPVEPTQKTRPGAAAAYERRQREAELHRAAVQRRNDERARRRLPAAPLPDPPARTSP